MELSLGRCDGSPAGGRLLERSFPVCAAIITSCSIHLLQMQQHSSWGIRHVDHYLDH